MIPVAKVELGRKAWLRFTEMGELMPGVRPAIARSWFRCKKSGLSPYADLKADRVDSAEAPGQPCSGNGQPGPGELTWQSGKVNQGIAKFRDKRETISAVLQRLYAWTGLDEGLLVLTDREATVLARCGHINPFSADLWQVGECLSESKYGTIAPVLIFSERERCFEVKGPEHFLACLQEYHSLAVQITVLDEALALSLVAPLGKLGLQAEGLLLAAEELLRLRLAVIPKDKVALAPGPDSAVRTLAEVERLAILEALEQFSGNISQTAAALEVSRNTLYNKMRKYGLTAKQENNQA